MFFRPASDPNSTGCGTDDENEAGAACLDVQSIGASASGESIRFPE